MLFSPALRRQTVPLLVWLLAAVAGLAAQEFWDKKPPAEWTVEEALKVVRDSDWAHVENVLLPFGNYNRPDPPRWRGLFGNWASYLVRWESASVVVQAFARLEELGQNTSAQFQAPAPRLPADLYVITVKTTRLPRYGFDVLRWLSEEQLLRQTRLRTSRGDASPVLVERSGMGAAAAVHFYFPRTLNDKPVLRPREQVEFRLEMNRFRLKSKFRVERE
jgi:hypothetical protein